MGKSGTKSLYCLWECPWRKVMNTAESLLLLLYITYCSLGLSLLQFRIHGRASFRDPPVRQCWHCITIFLHLHLFHLSVPYSQLQKLNVKEQWQVSTFPARKAFSHCTGDTLRNGFYLTISLSMYVTVTRVWSSRIVKHYYNSLFSRLWRRIVYVCMLAILHLQYKLLTWRHAPR